MADNEEKNKPDRDDLKKTSSSSANDEISFEEFEEVVGGLSDDTGKKNKKIDKAQIDFRKLERIKKELYEDDFDLEKENKSIAQMHQEEIYTDFTHGSLTSREDRIAEKNKQLMEEVYKYGRQKTHSLQLKAREKINVALTVILFLLLVAVLTLGIYLYLQKITKFDRDYIRISVSMTNKEIFYDTQVTGDLIPKSVSPGDKFNLNIVASNSNKIAGDDADDAWANIYVRFKISLIVNGIEYKDFVYVEPNPENWERYNKEVEDTYLISETDPTAVVKEDDGYYYCRLILEPNQQVTIIEWLRFSEVNITEMVGGNDAVLQVDIDVLEAIPSILKNREIWSKAPQHWVLYMTDEDRFPDTGEEGRPDKTVNAWWVIIFIASATLLVAIIVFVTTRNKTDKLKRIDLNRVIRRNKKDDF